MYMGMLMPKKRNICIPEQLKEAKEIVNTVDETTEKRVMHGRKALLKEVVRDVRMATCTNV
jgi:hypothetical protein